MTAAMRDPNETRRMMNALPREPVITVDETGQIILDSAHPLANPPAVVGSAALDIPNLHDVALIKPPIIELPPTIPALIKDWFIRGEGIIATYIAGWTGLAVFTGLSIYWWCCAVVHTLVAAVTALAADAGIAVLVMAAVMLLFARGRSGGGLVNLDLKGCFHGSTPGVHTIRFPSWMVKK